MFGRVRLLHRSCVLLALLCAMVAGSLTAAETGVQLARNFSLGSTRQYMVDISMVSTLLSSTTDPTQMNMKLSMTEKTDSFNTDGTARINRSFTPLLTEMNGRSIPCRSMPQSTSLTINRQNYISKVADLDVKSLLPNGTPELGWLGLNYGCIVTFPSNRVLPGSCWEAGLSVSGSTPATVVKHTLVGLEVRRGKKVARVLSSFDTNLDKLGYPVSEGTVGVVNVRFTSFIDLVTGDMLEGEGRSESKLVINPPAEHGYATQPLSMNCVTTVVIKPLL